MLDIGNVVAAFSEDQVLRLTGLTKGRLRYWDKSDFFKPSFAGENKRLAYSRFYSFKDVVALRTLEMLRVQNNVPLQHLRKVAETLAHLKDDLWTKTTLYVCNRKVVFMNPETGEPQEVVSGQYLLGIPLQRVIADTSNDIEQMKKRSNDEVGQITRSRAIVHNAWVISGTRIPVGAIKRLREDGYSVEAIIAEYPDLTADDVKAAIKHKPTKAA
ncbi:MAG: DUF433 domain-containing protein [Rhodospirillales bacterium]|nr:DUF433 domain-containing protein [Rhodospirillales bacterium]